MNRPVYRGNMNEYIAKTETYIDVLEERLKTQRNTLEKYKERSQNKWLENTELRDDNWEKSTRINSLGQYHKILERENEGFKDEIEELKLVIKTMTEAKP